MAFIDAWLPIDWWMGFFKVSKLCSTLVTCKLSSPVEFKLLLKKIMMKQTSSICYIEFSEDNETYPCQAVSFEEKS